MKPFWLYKAGLLLLNLVDSLKLVYELVYDQVAASFMQGG